MAAEGAAVQAKAMWERASGSAFTAWSKRMQDQTRADVAALREEGEANQAPPPRGALSPFARLDAEFESGRINRDSDRCHRLISCMPAHTYPHALSAAGESVSESQEADLLKWWARPIPYDEANAVWTSYLGEAGMPHGPSLHQVSS